MSSEVRPLRVLIVEDQPADAELMVDELIQAGFDPAWRRVDTEAQFLAQLEQSPELILADYRLPRFDGLSTLALMQERGLDIPLIIVSGSIGEERAVAAMKLGAADYLLKDRLARLGAAVSHALEEKRLRQEKQQAEQALRASEERFRSLIENGSDVIITIDANRRITYVSPSIERALGYHPDEVTTDPGSSRLHPDDRPLAAGAFQQLRLTPGGSVSLELRLQHKDASWRIFEITASNLLENASVQAIVLNAHDVTGNRRAEESLDEERKLLRTIIDALPDFIYLKDTQGRFVTTNLANLQALGASTIEEIAGKTDFDFYPGELAEQFYAAEQEIVQSGQPLVNQEETIALSPEDTRSVLTTKVPLRDNHDQIIGLVGIGRDITERRRAEAELLEAELLRNELQKERELIELRERFISMVSHDFRTPLTVIQASSDLLGQASDQMSADKRQKYVQSIRRQINYMTEMLDDVLMVNKAQTGKLIAELAPLDLLPFCRDVFEQLQATDQGQHPFVFTADEDLGMVLMDEHLLRRILVNLLSNAIKYSPEGGEIRLDLRRSGSEFVFAVSDQGIGIPAADQKRMFEAFHRATNVRKIRGTGLGLAIVKSSIDALGGAITWQSQEGQGTMFSVQLPANPALPGKPSVEAPV
ncbi:MAG TPA: PAS domain S-box protein [Aggregatilineales bacterium]|nr:PAS domain S-box protein [Aggregatilineales bacterium]